MDSSNYIFIFLPQMSWEMIQFEIIPFSNGWLNHQLGLFSNSKRFLIAIAIYKWEVLHKDKGVANLRCMNPHGSRTEKKSELQRLGPKVTVLYIYIYVGIIISQYQDPYILYTNQYSGMSAKGLNVAVAPICRWRNMIPVL